MRRATPLLLVAREELLLAVRSRWTLIFAGVFALLATGVAASGYILSGGSGLQDLARTSASLVQLVVLLVPLAALLMGVLTIAPERSTSELLFAQPVSRRAILLGRVIGLAVALAAAEAVGFGTAGLLVFFRAGDEGAAGFAQLVGFALLLTAIFVSLAALIASAATGRRRGRALAIALVVWFAAVILVDLAALGVASLLPSGPASRVLVAAVLANPAAAVRTGALLGIEGTAAFGAGSLALLRATHGPLGAAVAIAVSSALWVVLPLTWADRRLARVDL